MTFRSLRVAQVLLLILAAATLFGQPRLNPLVERRAQASAAVPPECADALAPTEAPRVEIREIPLPEPARPAIPPPPPGADLRNDLRAVQTALEREDRRAFDAALARVKTTLEDYPRGGERTAAEEAVRVYDDIAMTWNAQFRSPFFDEESEVYARVNAYPGFQEAVRRQVLTDRTGRRFYPAREARVFLQNIATQRLSGVGIQIPPARTTPSRRPVVRETEPEQTADAPLSAVRPRRAPVQASILPPRRSASSSSSSRTRSTSSPAPARSAAVSAASAGSPSPTPAADNNATPAAPDVADTSATSAPPVVTDPAPVPLATTETTPPSPSTDTPPTTATVAPPPGTTTAPAPGTEPPSSRGRSVVVPALLVLVGIVVLIVLFRASSS